MSIVAISNIRTAPVGEDLTTEENRLSVLRGLELAYRVDKPLADVGSTLLMGEWAVLNSDGKAERPGATPVGNTYLVFCGTDRFDVKATGAITLLMGVPLLVKSSRFDTTQTYAVGDLLTVKDLGGGEAYPTKAASGEAALGRVMEVNDAFLVYETLGGAAVAP